MGAAAAATAAAAAVVAVMATEAVARELQAGAVLEWLRACHAAHAHTADDHSHARTGMRRRCKTTVRGRLPVVYFAADACALDAFSDDGV